MQQEREIKRGQSEYAFSWEYENPPGYPYGISVTHKEVIIAEGSGHAAGGAACSHEDLIKARNHVAAYIVQDFGQPILNEVRECILSGKASQLKPSPYEKTP